MSIVLRTPSTLILLSIVCPWPIGAVAQHTFSIAAVDPETSEIGSAGATCLDNVMLNGEEGALVISDILPGVGVIHTQAQWIPENQNAARDRMILGESPQSIIRWLRRNDAEVDDRHAGERQYGIVDLNAGTPRAAAFTGDQTPRHAGHLTGPTYSIQGNILLSLDVLSDMESAFLSTRGQLSDRLMAALLAAKRIGADARCAIHGVSSLSAFLRVASDTDTDASYGKLSLDLNIGRTPVGVDPIDVLYERYLELPETAE